MQSVSSRIWTRVALSISNDDNGYTKGTLKIIDGMQFAQKYARLSTCPQHDQIQNLHPYVNKKNV